ncbi:hypothetical protein VTN77DRAFT_474 [Rasamsonia byssochlamydoides]|uniref:uncharacterized protein n=1 Tax=Rasamsonia byssochlamydoides TaxID=89139 RepID=UPI003741F8C7
MRRLRTADGCERTLGRPRFRQRWPSPRQCLDEICLIEADDLERSEIKCRFSNLNCHAFVPCDPQCQLNEFDVSVDPSVQGGFESGYGTAVQFLYTNMARLVGYTSSLLVRLRRIPGSVNQEALQSSLSSISSNPERDTTDVYIFCSEALTSVLTMSFRLASA